jgi:release factor glutamine methyltransferase
MSYSTKNLYDQVVNKLIPVYGEEESRQLSRILLQELLGISFEKVLVDEKLEIASQTLRVLWDKVEKIKMYQPIQYVLGKAHFFGRDFVVNPSVLIPRQETEELVREILIDNPGGGQKILDIGTGSGCIGITLALEMSNAQVTMLDVDGSALEITKKNADRFGLDAEFRQSDVLALDSLDGEYDIIVSNPPYIAEEEKVKIPQNVLKHEPEQALFVPDDHPLLFYEKIIGLSKTALRPGGRLYFEINERFGMEMIRLAERSGCSYVQLLKDLNGKDRILKLRFG